MKNFKYKYNNYYTKRKEEKEIITKTIQYKEPNYNQKLTDE